MMLGTGSAYLASSILTLNEAGLEAASLDKNDTPEGKYKSKSLVKNVSGFLKALSYNNGRASDVDPDNPRDMKEYFLENCHNQDVNSAQILPLEQLPARAKEVLRSATQATDRVLQRICKGGPWSAESIAVLQAAGGEYIDFSQNKSFCIPTTKAELELLYEALLDANTQLFEATHLLVRIAKSCYKTVTASRSVLTDQDVEYMSQHKYDFNIVVNTPEKQLLFSHSRPHPDQVHVLAFTDQGEEHVKKINDSFSSALAAITTCSALISTLSTLIQTKHLYASIAKLTQDNLDEIKSFQIPTKLQRLFRQHSMSDSTNDIQFNHLYKSTFNKANDLIDAFENNRDLLQEKVDSKIEIAESFFNSQFVRADTSPFALLYTSSQVLPLKYKTSITKIPAFIQHLLDTYNDDLLPTSVEIPGTDTVSIDNLISKIQKFKIGDTSKTVMAQSDTSAKMTSAYISDRVSAIRNKVDSLKQLKVNFDAAPQADKVIADRFKASLKYLEELFIETSRNLTFSPNCFSVADADEFHELKKTWGNGQLELFYSYLSSMQAKVHEADIQAQCELRMANSALPKNEAPTFNNMKQDFIAWKNSFKLVYYDSLPERNKLVGLTSCLHGEALKFIKGANYQEAMAILTDKYGKDVDELHRTLSELEELKTPQNSYQYMQMLVTLSTAKRWLSSLNQGHHLDRTRIRMFVAKLFTNKYAVKFQDIIGQEEKLLSRQYRTIHGCSIEEAIMKKINGDPALNISDQVYGELFWEFVHSEASSYSAVNSIKRPSGPIFKRTDYPDRNEGDGDRGQGRDRRRRGYDRRSDYRSDRRQGDGYDSRLNQNQPHQSQPKKRFCNFCNSGDHFTDKCPKHIPKRGEVAPDILDRCSKAGVCVRCIKPKSIHRDSKCNYDGYYHVINGARKKTLYRL